MRASSTASLGAGQLQLEKSLSEAAPARLSQEFFYLADLLRDKAHLARALTDPSRVSEDKQKLVSDLLADTLDPVSLKVTNTLVAGRWSDEADLSTAFEELGTQAQIEAALVSGELDRVEKELFAVTEFLDANRKVRNSLTDIRGYTVEERVRVARRLFGEHIGEVTLNLVARAVATSAAGRLLWRLRQLAEMCAQARQRDLVTVSTATPLSSTQMARLQAALKKMTGRDMTVNVSVEPELIGGMQVRVGSKRIDGSLLSSLETIRRQLAG